MLWLRRLILALALICGLAVLVLTVYTLWGNAQGDFLTPARRVQDLEILLVIVLGLSALYTIFFLVSPSLNDRILKQQADTMEEIRSLKREIESQMREQAKNIQHAVHERSQLAPPPPPTKTAADTTSSGREYLLLAGRMRTVERELVRVYGALATLFSAHDTAASKAFLHQALALAPDVAVTAGIHYELGCLLAKTGDFEDATEEIRSALRNKAPELERRLAKDTEEGGPLFTLASTAPGDEVFNDLLMSLSVGS